MSKAFDDQTPRSMSPWKSPWPVSELERVFICPVCESAAREVLHEGLIDNVFFVAHGLWKMHRCTACQSAYLDPRPTPASIGKAYSTYHTHAAEVPREDAKQLGGFRRWRRMLANGYTNYRYGTAHQPARIIGVWVAFILRQQRHALDIQYRYLPKPQKGQRLLDIGCGNGSFLDSARAAGWDVMGLEPDPKAANAARHSGLNVKVGTIDDLANVSNCFDAITLSHVIEHVHMPLEVMASVHRLLKPGGVIYIETPNIASYGAKLFGANWRGLEVPRHLVLFNPFSLQKMLAEKGFEHIKMIRRPAVLPGMFISSLLMLQGRSPYNTAPAEFPTAAMLKIKPRFTKTENLEFITLVAVKSA